jgi:hypothetical protein
MRLSLPFWLWRCEADRILTSSERKQALIVNPHLAMRLAYAWMPETALIKEQEPKQPTEPEPKFLAPNCSHAQPSPTRSLNCLAKSYRDCHGSVLLGNRYDPRRLRPAPRVPPCPHADACALVPRSPLPAADPIRKTGCLVFSSNRVSTGLLLY